MYECLLDRAELDNEELRQYPQDSLQVRPGPFAREALTLDEIDAVLADFARQFAEESEENI